MNTLSAPETKHSIDAPNTEIQEVAKDSVKQPRPEGKVTNVETEKKNIAEPSREAEKKIALQKQTTSTKLRYTIQVSSYLERQAAEEDVRRMKQNGFAAFIVSSEVQGKGTWYRVRIGRFTNRDAAEKLQKEIHTKVGMESIVVLE